MERRTKVYTAGCNDRERECSFEQVTSVIGSSFSVGNYDRPNLYSTKEYKFTGKLLIINIFMFLITATRAIGAPSGISISGTVVSESLKPIPGAHIAIKAALDSTILGNAVANEEGNYVLNVSPDAEIIVEVSALGYHTYTSESMIAGDRILNICLTHNTISIDEVVVTGIKPLVRMQAGNLVVDATQVPNVESMTLERLLNRLPGVSTLQGLTLNGRGATLYIDGVRQQAGAESTMRALSGAIVGDVELLSMPTAEYGVTSETIINVKTKKRGWDGYYLSLGATVDVHRDGQVGNYDNIVLVLKKKNITFNSMLSFDSSHESYSRTDTTWYAVGAVQDKKIDLRNRLNTVQFLGNLNYETKTGHSLNLNTYIYDDHGRTAMGRQIGELFEDGYSSGKYHTDSRGHDDLWSTRFEYRSPDSLRTRGTLSYGFLYGGNHSDNNYLTGEPYVGYMTSKLDMVGYMHTIKGVLRQDVGYKRRLTVSSGFNAMFGKLNDRTDYNMVDDPTDNTHSRFTGRENALDLYVQAQYKFSDSWSMHGHFTATYTDYDLDLKSENLHTKLDYWHYFPYLTLSFNTKNYKSTLGFTSSMARPDYEWMLPGVRYADEYSYTVGNPNLSPVIRSNLVWNNLLWGYATIQLAYTQAKNVSGSVMIEQGTDNTVYSYMNYADFDRYLIYTSLPYELIGGRLSGELAFSYSYGSLKRARNGFIVPRNRTIEERFASKLDINYEFTDDFSVFCYLGYDTPRRSIQSTTEDLYFFGLGANYSCLKDRLTFSVNFYDILGLQDKYRNSRNYFGGNHQRIYWRPVSGPRTVGLSIRWMLNKGEKVTNRAKDVQMDNERFGSR